MVVSCEAWMCVLFLDFCLLSGLLVCVALSFDMRCSLWVCKKSSCKFRPGLLIFIMVFDGAGCLHQIWVLLTMIRKGKGRSNSVGGTLREWGIAVGWQPNWNSGSQSGL